METLLNNATDRVQNLMISGNANTVFNAISFNQNLQLGACATANTVLIIDPNHLKHNNPKVLFTLNQHTGRVNGLKWLNDTCLLSIGGDDKSWIVWEHTGVNPRDYTTWKVKQQYENAHEDCINYLANYQVDGEIYFATMSTDGSVRLWQQDSKQADSQFKKAAELLFGKNLQESIAITQVGENHLMVVLGGYDSKIHVYTIPRIHAQKEQVELTYHFSLLGHLNSVKDFSFTSLLKDKVRYLASCSQDQNIRLWKIQPLDNLMNNIKDNSQPESTIDTTNDDDGNQDLQFQKYQSKTSFILSIEGEQVYNLTLESVLIHHAEAVSSVQWGFLQSSQTRDSINDLCLLSSSFDFTVALWQQDPDTLTWTVKSALGALVGNKHAYFGAMFIKDDQQILAYTYGGAMHQWIKDVNQDSWHPQLTVKGHFGAVSDLDWDQYQMAIVSTSLDQTTRVFSQYGKDNGWYEFGRPQVHGYDMNTLACLPTNSSEANLASRILSGGDEKVLRLFEAPYNFIKTMNSLHPEADQFKLRFSDQKTNEEVESTILGSEARKQPLGLMNKPQAIIQKKPRVNDAEEGGSGLDFDPVTVLSNTKKEQQDVHLIQEPPVEDVLMARTLWPEQRKLYGHVFEVFCIATTSKGDCAASACKAKDKEYADIIIWDLTKDQVTVPACRLTAHKLTVVQIEFSKDDQYLLSCSRDRQWSLFKRQSPDSFSFFLIKKQKDAHTRIIWGVSWSHDDQFFATASREKTNSVKFWNGIVKDETVIGKQHSEIASGVPSATAIRFLPNLLSSNYSVAVGLESGELSIWSTTQNSATTWTRIILFPLYLSHNSPVRRIKFNQRLSNEEQGQYMVATCGNDNTVRLFNVLLKQ